MPTPRSRPPWAGGTRPVPGRARPGGIVSPPSVWGTGRPGGAAPAAGRRAQPRSRSRWITRLARLSPLRRVEGPIGLGPAPVWMGQPVGWGLLVGVLGLAVLSALPALLAVVVPLAALVLLPVLALALFGRLGLLLGLGILRLAWRLASLPLRAAWRARPEARRDGFAFRVDTAAGPVQVLLAGPAVLAHQDLVSVLGWRRRGQVHALVVHVSATGVRVLTRGAAVTALAAVAALFAMATLLAGRLG